MFKTMDEVRIIRERAEAHERGGRWGEAADAYDELARAWIKASALAATAEERGRRKDLADAARSKAADCRKKAPGRHGPDPQKAKEEDPEFPESDFLVEVKPSETLDDIQGMEAAKQAVRDLILDPLNHPEKAKQYGIRPGGGILLYGPPGNGKTLFGKAIANRIDAPFYYVSGAAIRSKWVGESAQRLHALFVYARRHPVSVVFFDEFETLVPKREGDTSGTDRQIVTQFLQETEGFFKGDNVLLMLAATNCPWDVDVGGIRTGRFDTKVFIGAPDRAARLGMLQRAFRNVALDPGVDLERWADRLELYTGSDIAGLAAQAKRTAFRRSLAEPPGTAVSEPDLEEALGTITRSITPGLLKKYEEYAKQGKAG